MRVLVIEDEALLARQIGRVLAHDGHEVTSAADGESGLETALKTPHDLIVLDLGLPRLSGMEVLTRLRDAGSLTRVIILTARGDVGDRVKGLRAGADDYLGKPFSSEELLARIDALGRRGGKLTASAVLNVEDLHMDLHHRRVVRAGQTISLSPREFDVLQVLLQDPGRVFSRTELCERVWQRQHAYETRTVEIFITRLRKKIDVGFGPPLIHTVRSVGYKVSLTP